MNVAVLSLTRDRLAYTQHCFETLHKYAGCEFTHCVFDNASEDDTIDWLLYDYEHEGWLWAENIGICRALNIMLNDIEPERYDVIVRFDNDCEVLQPDTLRVVCEVALEHDAIVAPHVRGLLNPPQILGTAQLGQYALDETAILGGIFMAVPAQLYWEHGFRYDESFPPYTGDEAIVPWWRARGGRAGYLQGWAVNHYLSTLGQRADQLEYEQRKLAEMGR